MSYYFELIQTDPEGSPTPGCAHYAGEVVGFATADEARVASLPHLGKPVPADLFWPCCDWQKPETIVTATVVYWEDPNGNRAEENGIQSWFRGARA